MINHLDCSIRKSADQSVLTTPRGLSQLTTSFIGSWCQGIHPALFLTLPIFKWVSVLFKNCSFPTRKISFTRISLVALLVVSYLHFSILFSSCSVLFQEQVSAKGFLLLISILEKRFPEVFSSHQRESCVILTTVLSPRLGFPLGSGHKWTRTTDLTLIRRAL